MSIMRRGPLDRYPAGWLLKEAAAHRIEGSIAFYSDRPVTFFLNEGLVYAAVAGVGGDGPADETPLGHDDESAARAQTVLRLIDVLCSVGGWYYLDPLGRHPTHGWWSWEMDSLFVEARAKSPEATAAFVLANRRIQLNETQASPISLDPDAWAVIAALASSATAEEIRTRLEWNPARLLSALTQLNHRGALDPNPERRRARDPAPQDLAAKPDVDLDLEELEAEAESRVVAARPADPPADLDPGAQADEGPGKADKGIGANAPASAAWTAWNTINPEPPGPLPIPPKWRAEPEEPPARSHGRRRHKPPGR